MAIGLGLSDDWKDYEDDYDTCSILAPVSRDELENEDDYCWNWIGAGEQKSK